MMTMALRFSSSGARQKLATQQAEIIAASIKLRLAKTEDVAAAWLHVNREPSIDTDASDHIKELALQSN